MALTSLTAVKEFLSIPVLDTDSDALLTNIINRASAFIEMWLGRTVLSASYTDWLDGWGGSSLMIANNPVTAVSSLVVDGVTIPVSTDWNVAGYVIDRFQIVLRGYTFSRGTRNVKVSYTGGYVTVPYDIDQACIDLVALKYKSRSWIGFKSKAVGTENVTFSSADLEPATKIILNNYRSVFQL